MDDFTQPKEGCLGGEKGDRGVKHGVLHPQGGGGHVTQVRSGLSVEHLYILRLRLMFRIYIRS